MVAKSSNELFEEPFKEPFHFQGHPAEGPVVEFTLRGLAVIGEAPFLSSTPQWILSLPRALQERVDVRQLAHAYGKSTGLR